MDLPLDALRAEGLVGADGKARTDSTHVISAVRDLSAYWNGHALDRTRTSHLTRLELTLAA